MVLFHVQTSLYHAYGGAFDTRPPPNDFVMRLIDQGRFGVHIFFIISGFLLALPFAATTLKGARPVRLRAYYLRRVTRLEPPYILMLSLAFALSLITPLWPHIPHVGAHYGAGLAYGHVLAFGHVNPILIPTWSLEVEIQFYLLVPLLARLFRIEDLWTRRAVIVATGLGGLIAQVFLSTVPQLSETVVAYLPFFMAGFLVADVYLVEWNSAPSTGRGWDLVSLVGWPLFFLGAATGSAFQTALMPWVGAALLVATFRGQRTRRLLRNRWIVTIGGMCYSIYLIHFPLLEALARIHPGVFGSSLSGLAVLGSLLLWAPVVALAGGLFYALVERPCMEPDWPRRLIRRAAEVTRWTRSAGPLGEPVGVALVSKVEGSPGDVSGP